MKRDVDALVAPKKGHRVAFPFVLDALAPLGVETRPLFGSTAVYVGEEVLFILREKGDDDDGVWVAFDPPNEAAALRALPRLAPIACLPKVRCWRKLAASSPQFEADVREAIRLAAQPERPIGKIPTRARAKVAKAATTKKRPTAATTKKRGTSSQ